MIDGENSGGAFVATPGGPGGFANGAGVPVTWPKAEAPSRTLRTKKAKLRVIINRPTIATKFNFASQK